MTRDELLGKIRSSYAGTYDLEEVTDSPELPGLTLKAHFHVEESQYMISKKAVMYSTKSDEYVWFFSMPKLTDAQCEKCIQYVWNTGLPMACQDGHQMVTRLVAVFLCDEMEEAAKQRICKCAYYKSFQFSLKGWAECHTAAADLGKEEAVSNRYGRETAKHLKNLMHPPKRKSSGLSRFISILKKMD